jgi:hypothetical protein
MTVATKERSASGSATMLGRLFDPGGERSLDDVVSIAWQSMAAPGHRPDCLVCGESLVWNGDERAAECDSCGTRLD